MPPARIRMPLSLDLGQRHQRVLQQLALAGRGDLARQMTATIRKTGGPALDAVRAALRSADLPTTGPKGRTRAASRNRLRQRIARATSVTTARGGVRIWIDGKKVDPAYGTALVMGLNSYAKLRHPTFGRRGAGDWVTQRGSKERFYSTLRPYEAEWRAGVEQVMDDYVRQIES